MESIARPRKREYHGMQRTPEFKAWDNMKQRCYNPNYIKSKNYLGRGITVCDEWRNSFLTFYKDMGDRPAGTSLDRINNDLGYSASNCRWADIYTQNNNTRLANNNGKRRGIATKKKVTRGRYFTGIHKDRKKWLARLEINGVVVLCERYSDVEEAVSARLHAECIYL